MSNTKKPESPKSNIFEIGLGVTKKVSGAVRDAAKAITSTIDNKLTEYYKKTKGQDQKPKQTTTLKK